LPITYPLISIGKAAIADEQALRNISKTQIVLEPLGGLDTFLEVWITLASNFSKTRKSFVYSKAFVRDHTDLKGFVSDT
jgi:hypothetical protein